MLCICCFAYLCGCEIAWLRCVVAYLLSYVVVELCVCGVGEL